MADDSLDLPWQYDFVRLPELTAFYSHSLVTLLDGLGVTLFVSSMPAGKLIVVHAVGNRLSLQVRSFEQITGIAVDRHHLAVATAGPQTWLLPNEPALAAVLAPDASYDACFVCRTAHFSGTISSHEIAWTDNGLLIANTRFSCLCSLDEHHSFVPRWQPPFVSELAPEDRCHLSGLALEGGTARYVTCFGATDSAAGWRRTVTGGGCLVDVPGVRIVADGLTMPHSPRLLGDKVFLLDSGTGRLVAADPASGRVTPVVEFGAFLRGLAFAGSLAFVGLSKMRRLRTSLALDCPLLQGDGRCGVWVIDVATARTVGFVEFVAGIDEIFDVQLLDGVRCPTVIGPATRAGSASIAGTYVLPGGRVIAAREEDLPLAPHPARDTRVSIT